MAQKLEQLGRIFWSKAYFPMILSMSMKGSVRARADTRVSVLDLDNSVRFSAGYVKMGEEAPDQVAFHLFASKVMEPH